MSAQYALWIGWIVCALAWAIAWSLHGRASGRKPTNLDYANRALIAVGIILLGEFHTGILERYHWLWHGVPEWMAWLLTFIAYLGFALAWWSYATVGKRAQRAVVQDGPYQYVRHPMFLGIIVAAFAHAAMRGTIDVLLGAILIATGFYLRAQVEEEVLRVKLGPAYDSYAAKTAMMVPFIWLTPFSVGQPPRDAGSLP